MEETTFSNFSLLKEALASDPRVLALEELEKQLPQNEDIARLSAAMKQKAEAYEDAQSHYGENSPLTKEAQKALFLAKKELDEHPLSLEYTAKYKEVSALYRQVDEILFGFLRSETPCGGRL